MNEQIRKNNSSTKEGNQSKEMGTREVYDCQQQKWVPYISDPDKCYQDLLDVRDGTRNVTVMVVIWWVVDVNTES